MDYCCDNDLYLDSLGYISDSRDKILNLANRLSLTRIFLSFIFMICLFGSALFWRVTALFFFILAVVTDIYDGRWARCKNKITPLGILLDPLADKILITCAFISFVDMEEISVPAWMVVIIISREFSVMGLRLLAAGKGEILPAERQGKRKTISQMGGVILILLYLIIRGIVHSRGLWSEGMEMAGRAGVYAVMFITLILTVLSGYFYLTRYRDVLLR